MSFLSQTFSWQNIVEILSKLSQPISFNNQRLANVATPMSATDAATKGYVDTIALTDSSSIIENCVCDTNDQIGNGVYITDVIGSTYYISKVDITNSDKMPMAGLIIDKPASTTATLQLKGEITIFNNLIPNKIYFIGDDGFPTVTPPILSIPGIKYIQNIGIALSQNVLLLNGSFELLKLRNE